jgi:hypothetical protein
MLCIAVGPIWRTFRQSISWVRPAARLAMARDPNLERPLPKSAVRYGEDDEIYYRGVKCRAFTAREYERIKD